MQAWQEAYEKGQATHSFAPFGYREAAMQGKLRKEEIPYIVRGGSWDNSDVFGAKRLPWMKKDKEYAKGGYKREQSIFPFLALDLVLTGLALVQEITISTTESSLVSEIEC